jgi:hypothetical protein
VVRRLLIWLRLEKKVIEWIGVLAVALLGLIAFNIFMALQPHRTLNTLLEYREQDSVSRVHEFSRGIRELPR